MSNGGVRPLWEGEPLEGERGLKVAGAAQKRRTPQLFAEWLVGLAGSAR